MIDHVVSVGARQHQIEKDGIVLAGADGQDCFLAIRDGVDDVAVAPQQRDEQIANAAIVFDHQYLAPVAG